MEAANAVSVLYLLPNTKLTGVKEVGATAEDASNHMSLIAVPLKGSSETFK